jgi:hypothetical protein
MFKLFYQLIFKKHHVITCSQIELKLNNRGHASAVLILAVAAAWVEVLKLHWYSDG